MPDPDFSPEAIVEKLKTERVKLRFLHQYAEYDDFYTIWYTPRWKRFQVRLEVSVWDGRGHESYKESLEESVMLERLEKIKTQGQIRQFYYEARS